MCARSSAIAPSIGPLHAALPSSGTGSIRPSPPLSGRFRRVSAYAEATCSRGSRQLAAALTTPAPRFASCWSQVCFAVKRLPTDTLATAGSWPRKSARAAWSRWPPSSPACTRRDAPAGLRQPRPPSAGRRSRACCARPWPAAPTRAARPPGNAYDERNLVFETLWGRPALSPRHLAALRWRLLPALADGLRGTIRVSTAYRTLLGHFIRNFGKGGVCPNLLDWLVRVAELSPGGVAFEEDAEVRASLSLTVYLTMVDGRPGDAASGSLHAACQTIHPWGLWQTGRFTYGCSRPARLLRRRLRRYLYRTRHPREPVSFLPDADIMNLQANSPLTRRVLDWPTQTRHAGTAFVDPSTMSVRHCVETNTFGLFDAAGAEIALVYGGGLVPSPTMTAGSLMVALANPFEVPPLAPVLAAPGKPEVVAVPRKYLGDLVVARAFWWVPSPVLREAAEASGFDRYLALRRIWRRLQLPDRSFISGFTSGRQSGSFWDTPPRVSRSSWFDARVESCLEELPDVLSHDWVILQEAFPSGSEIVSWRRTEVRANSVCAEAFLPRVTASLHDTRVAAGVVRSAP